LSNKQLSALPPLRFRICAFSRGVQPLNAAISSFERGEFRRHGRGKSCDSLFGGIFGRKRFEWYLRIGQIGHVLTICVDVLNFWQLG
jgi:hypothetical protein